MCCFANTTYSQVSKADSVKRLLCDKTWHLTKLTDMNKGGSMGGEVFIVDTKFNLDGTLETTTSGNLVNDVWKLNVNDMTLETSQLKDPKTGQEKINIVKLTDKSLVVRITYRGNNVMQYDYQ